MRSTRRRAVTVSSIISPPPPHAFLSPPHPRPIGNISKLWVRGIFASKCIWYFLYISKEYCIFSIAFNNLLLSWSFLDKEILSYYTARARRIGFLSFPSICILSTLHSSLPYSVIRTSMYYLPNMTLSKAPNKWPLIDKVTEKYME